MTYLNSLMSIKLRIIGWIVIYANYELSNLHSLWVSITVENEADVYVKNVHQINDNYHDQIKRNTRFEIDVTLNLKI